MNIEQLRIYCLQQQGASEQMPFGPDTLVFKVANKVFLLVGLDQIDALSFNVKCDPERAIELREQFPETVFPGYHMNKKHWNTVFANRDLNDTTLHELIDHSYTLVRQSLTRKELEAIEKAE